MLSLNTIGWVHTIHCIIQSKSIEMNLCHCRKTSLIWLCHCSLLSLPTAWLQYTVLPNCRINLSITSPTASPVCPKPSSEIFIYFLSQESLNEQCHSEVSTSFRSELSFSFCHSNLAFIKITYVYLEKKEKKSKSLHKSFPQVVALSQMGDFLLSPFQQATFAHFLSFCASGRFIRTEMWIFPLLLSSLTHSTVQFCAYSHWYNDPHFISSLLVVN